MMIRETMIRKMMIRKMMIREMMIREMMIRETMICKMMICKMMIRSRIGKSTLRIKNGTLGIRNRISDSGDNYNMDNMVYYLEIKKEIEELLKLQDKYFAVYQVYIDPIQRKITPEIRNTIIEQSLTCGREEADKLLDKLKKQKLPVDIWQLIKEFGIGIKEEEGDISLNYIYFGAFEESGAITLYIDNIRKGEELIREYKIKELLNINLKEVILAHELFHYIEARNKKLFVNQYRIKLWKLGPYTHTSLLSCTSEIASMAFAKRLLNLNFCPNVLDVLLLYPHDRNEAKHIYRKIMDSGVMNSEVNAY
jgi:hypothetical protein